MEHLTLEEALALVEKLTVEISRLRDRNADERSAVYRACSVCSDMSEKINHLEAENKRLLEMVGSPE